MNRNCFFLICLASLAACTAEPPPPKEIDGYAPVYAEKAKPSSISYQQARPIEAAGKIYVKGTTLYQVENGKGIHVLSIADPQHPVRQGFIPIAGAQELSILNNSLYTNSFNDLLVLDITSLQNLTVSETIENAFTLTSSVTPPEHSYFECVDPSKGVVIGWTKKTIQSPKCKY